MVLTLALLSLAAVVCLYAYALVPALITILVLLLAAYGGLYLFASFVPVVVLVGLGGIVCMVVFRSKSSAAR